uniref:Uncharacterized protein n=1 Tax=Ascaris lumbricoides TaxID=6252 RepID=A0A0M3HIX6_ASCLU
MCASGLKSIACAAASVELGLQEVLYSLAKRISGKLSIKSKELNTIKRQRRHQRLVPFAPASCPKQTFALIFKEHSSNV